MMDCRYRWLLCAGGLSLALLSGCPTAPNYKVPEQASKEGEQSADAEKGPQLEPFDAPTMAELDAKADWQDQPVIDIMERFLKYKAENPPLVSVEEALKLKNDSDENNEKILSALGQPPKSDSEVNENAEIKRHIGGDINSTNPIMSSSVSDAEVNGLTGAGFFSFDWNMEPFAPKDTVVSWQTSKDLLYDKVVIRDDLIWSDGKPLTAYDVEFSFQMIMNPDVPVPAVRNGTDKLRWVKAYDERTFVIFHRESMATNVWNCNFPIVPKHIYEESIKTDPRLEGDYHQKLEITPVVAGPYQISKRIKGQEIVLERREDYYMRNGKQVRSKPRYKTIRFRVLTDSNTARLALNDGQLDEMLLTPQQWVEQTTDNAFYSKNTKVRGMEWTYFYFGWNMKKPWFTDLRVRQAMAYSVNYDQILNKLCYGLYDQASGCFAEGNWARSKKPRTLYKQDLAKAEKLLVDAGWVDTDGDGIRDKEINGKKVKFEFEIMCTTDQTRIDISTSLAESLNRLGIACNVKPTEFTVMQQRAQDHNYDAMFGGWGAGADPSTSENLWKTNESRNYGGYSNPKVDELFVKAMKELDFDKRAALYQEIDDILWEDQPYAWLYYRSGFYGFNKKLRGYTFSPRGPYSYSPGFDAFWTIAQ
ncbi:ABC transporter substrate-binding protein [Planctomicrobium sp. SH527]|uniref:ABC transporter substrate-binding protein n=1 Tax=Planctomicrobium sp. SH527 TaxID=3448123 RepID=UPI003F5C26E2